jgi:muramoyltetrapeptide carboxypeptidase
MACSAYLTCPAYPLRDAQMLLHAQLCADGWARELGWQLQWSPLCWRFGPRGQWHPAADRAADLHQALDHTLLWGLRGGYGCVELITEMQGWGADGPAVVGFSDLTVLHALRWRQGARPGIYGPMPAVAAGARARCSLIEAASGRAWQITSAESAGHGQRSGQAEGRLFAACLRVLASLVGTPAQPDLDGSILAIEDIDEAPYAVDRDLQQLHAAGLLRGVRALLANRFPWQPEVDHGGPPAAAVIAAWAERLGIPALVGLPFGHAPDPLALPQGRLAWLRVTGPDEWGFGWAAGAGLMGEKA